MQASTFRSQFVNALAGSTGVYLFGTVVSFLVGIQLARGLGAEGYGLYGSAMAAASLGATFAAGGLQLHATREIAVYRSQGENDAAARLVGWSVRNVLVLSVTASVAVGGYVLWVLAATPALALSAVALTVLMALLWLAGAVVRGTGAVVLGQAMDVAIRPAAQSGLLLIALLIAGTLYPSQAMALSCLAVILALPFGWGAISRVWTRSEREVADTERHAWQRASSTMGLTTVIRVTEAALPLIVIGAVSTMEDAGLYRVATAVAAVLSMPASMVSVMVPTMASSLYEQREMGKLKHLVTVSGLAGIIPTLVLTAVLWAHGETLLAMAFGVEYRASWSSLMILAVATVIFSLGGISVTLLHVAKRDAVVSRAFALSLAVTGAGLLVAAWEGQAEAIALAVLIGTAVRTVILGAHTKRLVGIDPTLASAFMKLK